MAEDYEEVKEPEIVEKPKKYRKKLTYFPLK